jgi:hypothetical protein
MKKLVFLMSLFMLFTNVKSQITANPNPFDKRAVLSYTLSSSDTISLVVYDDLGSKVLTVKNNVYLAAGSYQDSLIMDAFNPGSYFPAIVWKTANIIVSCKAVKTGATSIPVISGNGEIRLFPNPTTQKAHIDLGSAKSNVQVLLYDETGKVVYEDHVSGNALDLDLGPFAHGLYSLKLSDGTEQKIYKLIKE